MGKPVGEALTEYAPIGAGMDLTGGPVPIMDGVAIGGAVGVAGYAVVEYYWDIEKAINTKRVIETVLKTNLQNRNLHEVPIFKVYYKGNVGTEIILKVEFRISDGLKIFPSYNIKSRFLSKDLSSYMEKIGCGEDEYERHYWSDGQKSYYHE